MIRYANKFDNEAIKAILIDFALTIENGFSMDSEKWDLKHIEMQLTRIYAGLGFVLIDEKQTGILVAVKAPSFWFPDQYALYEMMWHSLDRKVAVELLDAYIAIGREKIAKEEIVEVHFSSFTDADYSRKGARKFHTDWVM